MFLINEGLVSKLRSRSTTFKILPLKFKIKTPNLCMGPQFGGGARFQAAAALPWPPDFLPEVGVDEVWLSGGSGGSKIPPILPGHRKVFLTSLFSKNDWQQQHTNCFTQKKCQTFRQKLDLALKLKGGSKIPPILPFWWKVSLAPLLGTLSAGREDNRSHRCRSDCWVQISTDSKWSPKTSCAAPIKSYGQKTFSASTTSPLTQSLTFWRVWR